MKTRWFVLLIGLAACVLSAQAQTKKKMLRGVEIRSNPDSVQQCFAHVHRCVVPVYVVADGPRLCAVFSDPQKIMVPKPNTDFGHNRIKIVWVLKKGTPDTKIGEYKFVANTGVIFNDDLFVQPRDGFAVDGNGFDVADTENPNADDDTGSAPSKRRFRWVSKHKVDDPPVFVNYKFNVKRTTTAFGVSETHDCDATDPTITNTN